MPPPALSVFRRYVTDFVNRHDFAALPRIMREEYTLITAGMEIVGRDGAYRDAVARQMAQFPGLTFTIHDLFVAGSSIGVRFTEHGASNRRDGARAAWPSIAIYDTQDGWLTRCTIEQDYFSRQRQLSTGAPVAIDPPAIAPWDEGDRAPDPAAEQVVRDWLASGRWLDGREVQIDDSRATGQVARIIAGGSIAIDRIISGGGRVAFHARHDGPLAADFAEETPAAQARDAAIALSGLVTVAAGSVVAGAIIRDRLGLRRRLEQAPMR